MHSPRSALLLAALLGACGERPAPTPEAAPPVAVVPTRDDAAGMTYSGIYDTTVSLRNGRYEAAPYEAGAESRLMVTLADGPLAMGDLTSDGVDDAVALLAANAGGTGVITYVAVLTGAGGTVHSAGTAPLGDRVDVRSMAITDGELVVQVIAAGPEDPSCCPTHRFRRTFALRDGALVETGSEDLGAIGAHELDGRWTLDALDFNDPVPDSIEVTLTVMDGQATGTSGCNRYRGPFPVQAGTQEVTPGPFAATRRLCPPPAMDVEGRYLEALGAVQQWGFIAGRLALIYRQDDGLATLLFRSVPRDSTPPPPASAS